MTEEEEEEEVVEIWDLHPQQRHVLKVSPSHKPEFIGSIKDMDVFWLQNPATVMVKFSSRTGDCCWKRAQERNARWEGGHSVSRKQAPTAEQLELALTMCKCFAQGGRLPEWDDEVVE